MSVKLFLLLALAAVGALAQDINELEFTLEGRRYTQTVVDGDDFQVVVVPKQGIADHTMVMHDFESRYVYPVRYCRSDNGWPRREGTRLTAFKDLTTRRCIVIPMNHMIVRVRGLVFKDRLSSSEAVPSYRNIMLDVDGNAMVNIDIQVGENIADLCDGFPTFWARISEEESTFNMSGRRFRRWGVSGSASASTNGRSASASGSVSGGSNGAESSSSSSSGKKGGSDASGSAN